MDFIKDVIAPIVGATGGIIGIGAMIYTWLTGGSKSNAADIKKLSDRLDKNVADLGKEADERNEVVKEDLKKHDRRIQRVEDELRHLPTKDEVHELKISLERLNGNVEVLTERLGAIGRVVTVIDETLRGDDSKTRGGSL